jgi:hypothetical protein
VGPGFSPLDEELGLLPGVLTPGLPASAVRLGSWLPFRPAAALLAHFTRVTVDEATIRRVTEAAGAAYVAVQTAAVERLERETPPPPPGPPTQQVSVDGAMVALVGGGWAEVKTLAIGTVQPPAMAHGGPVIRTTDLAYFSRLADHETFTRLALVETHRRGVTTAGRVAGVVDGALWTQQWLDDQRPAAVRILDFPPGAERVAAAGQAAGVADTAGTWVQAQLHELRHGAPEQVLRTRRALQENLTHRVAAGEAVAAMLETVTRRLHSLAERRAHIGYATFTTAGLPIGSGMVERANKLVVEARLKGAGRHWDSAHINPMLALRTIVCNDRWAEAWPQIVAQRRAQVAARRRGRRQQRQAAGVVPPPPRALPPPPGPRPPATRSATPTTHRPAANHPWRRYGQRLTPTAA